MGRPTTVPAVAHIAIAVALGLVAGLAAGGRPGAAPGRPLRWWATVLVGAAVQVAAVALDLDGAAATVAVLASYALLVTFAAANLRLAGMAVVLGGLTLNLTSMVANGGMPVRDSALVATGLVAEADLPAVDLGPKRHLETPADRLPALGDVIPVRSLRQVLSVGDVVLAAGVVVVTFRLVKPAGGAGTARPRSGPEVPEAGGAAGPPGARR